MVRNDEEEVQEEDEEESTEIDDAPEKPSSAQLRSVIETITDFSLFSESDEIRCNTIKLSAMMEKELMKGLTQTIIR